MVRKVNSEKDFLSPDNNKFDFKGLGNFSDDYNGSYLYTRLAELKGIFDTFKSDADKYEFSDIFEIEKIIRVLRNDQETIEKLNIQNQAVKRYLKVVNGILKIDFNINLEFDEFDQVKNKDELKDTIDQKTTAVLEIFNQE